MSNYYILDNSGVQIILDGSSGTLRMSIQSENHRQVSDLEVVAFAFSGSSQTEAYDYSGVRRDISLRGITSSSSSTPMQDLIDNFIIKLNDLQNGNQATRSYHSAILDDNRASGTYNDGIIKVKIRNFTWNWDAGKPTVINWTLDLVESV